MNLLTATRSLVVVTDADKMLTCWSEMERVTSDSSPVRSRASTWIATRNSESSVGDQRTATSRSGSESSRCRRLVQSARCTETPWPRVTNPVISSPGTGVQQRDSLAQTSAAPSTTTPESCAGLGRGGRVGSAVSARSSCAPATPPTDWTSLVTTDWALT